MQKVHHENHPHHTHHRHSLGKRILYSFFIFVFFFFGFLALWISTFKVPDLTSFDTRKITQSTKIYDRTGKVLLYDDHENKQSTMVAFENISKDIPILIICSKEDQLVPLSSSINVYKKLIASGHKHTYIFVTDYGRHAKILRGADGEKYQYVVNAFYKKYNLPYCSTSAAKGEDLLALCQPTF